MANTSERFAVYRGGVYLVRDLPKDEWVGPLHCEYATLPEGSTVLTWVPCVEGVMFDDIEPMCASSGGEAETDRDVHA